MISYSVLLLVLSQVLTTSTQSTTNNRDCAVLVDNPKSLFGQSENHTSPLGQYRVEELQQCVDICCLEETSCNVGLFKEYASVDEANCVLYNCHPLDACSMHIRKGAQVFVEASSLEGDMTSSSASTKAPEDGVGDGGEDNNSEGVYKEDVDENNVKENNDRMSTIETVATSAPRITLEEAATLTIEEAATPTLEETATPKLEETATPTLEETATPTLEETATPTLEETATPTLEETATPTLEETATPKLEETATPTLEETATPTLEETATPTLEETATPTFEQATIQTLEQVTAPTLENMAISLLELEPTPSTAETISGPTLEQAETPTLEQAETPTLEQAETPTLEQAETPTLEQAETPTLEQTETPTLEQTETPTLEQAETPTLEQTETPTLEQTETPTLEQAETPTLEQTEAPTLEQAETPTLEQTETPTLEQTETPTLEQTETPTLEQAETPTLEQVVTPSLKFVLQENSTTSLTSVEEDVTNNTIFTTSAHAVITIAEQTVNSLETTVVNLEATINNQTVVKSLPLEVNISRATALVTSKPFIIIPSTPFLVIGNTADDYFDLNSKPDSTIITNKHLLTWSSVKLSSTPQTLSETANDVAFTSGVVPFEEVLSTVAMEVNETSGGSVSTEVTATRTGGENYGLSSISETSQSTELFVSTTEADVFASSELHVHNMYNGSVFENVIADSDGLTAILILVLTFGCVFALAVIGVLGVRVYEGYRKRHYSRLDYLINGIYS